MNTQRLPRHVVAGRLRRPRARGLIGLALATLGFSAAGALTRQPDEAPPQPVSTLAAEEPGEAHALLASLVGAWDTASVLSIDGTPTSDADTGEARVEAIMGGRFIAIHESGTSFGEPTLSMKVYGYNTAAELFEATWVYTGSTAMMRARGISDPGTGVLTFQAQYASGPEQHERFIITLAAPGWHAAGAGASADAIAPPDRFTITLVALLTDGSAGPTLETTYTRAPD